MRHADEIITDFPIDHPVLFVDRREMKVVVRIYPGLENAVANTLRFSLKGKGFRRDDRVKHRDSSIDYLEEWVYPLRSEEDGILICLEGLCRVFNIRYVTSDPDDPELHRMPLSLLKISEHQYRSYTALTLL